MTYAISLGYQSDLMMSGFEVTDEALVNETGRHCVRPSLSATHMHFRSHGLRTDRRFCKRRSRREMGIELLLESRSGGLDTYGGVLDAQVAMEMARHGQRDVPLEALCAALDFEIESGEALLVAYSLGVLVELLASQGGSDGVAQAQDFVTRFEANVPAVPGPAIQLWLLRCRALLANAVGDTVIGSELLTKYRSG